jgi:predicted acetyltransferase
MFYLKEINFDDIEKEYRFVRDIPFDENGFINQWHGCTREAFDEVVRKRIAYSKGEELPEGYVPETFFYLWKDDMIVGEFRIRHFLCESLIEGAGHIGYFIGKEYRGRGYATEGLRLLLELARKIVPEEEIYLRVNKDNPASLRVMIKNGGRIDHEDEQKYYIRIKK